VRSDAENEFKAKPASAAAEALRAGVQGEKSAMASRLPDTNSGHAVSLTPFLETTVADYQATLVLLFVAAGAIPDHFHGQRAGNSRSGARRRPQSARV